MSWRRVGYGAAVLLASCAHPTPTFSVAAVRRAPAPLPHHGIVAAGRYLGMRADGRPFVDSFWVYTARSGGQVLEAHTRTGADPVAVTWLEVDPTGQPVRGWERRGGGPTACTRSFLRQGGVLEVTIHGAGAPPRLTLPAPARVAVAFDAPVAQGWAVAASGPDVRPVAILSLGSCPGTTEEPAGLSTLDFGRPAVAATRDDGHDRLAWQLTRRRLRADGAVAVDTLTVDPEGLWLLAVTGTTARLARTEFWRAGR